MNHWILYEGSSAWGNLKVEEEWQDATQILSVGLPESVEKLETCFASPQQFNPLYGGLSEAEIRDSGRDLLGEMVLKGSPNRGSVRGLLPPVGAAGYAVLGGQVSWSGLTVTRAGEVFLQTTGGANDSFPLFHPSQLHPSLGEILPEQRILDGELPILMNVYRNETAQMEIIQLCEPQDSDRNPTLWTWAVIREGQNGQTVSVQCLRSSYSRRNVHRPVEEAQFWEIFVEGVIHWKRELEKTAHFELPDQAIAKDVRAMLSTVYTTFSADHPHYGHKFYGQETHDYFLPALLCYGEALTLLGDGGRVRRALEHVMSHGFDSAGRLAYRQGEAELHGASASEYGQLFWLVERCEGGIAPEGWIEEYLPVLEQAGRMLMGQIKEDQLHRELHLIAMCAEADTNGRIHVYASNNLWAARGLMALSQLFERYGRKGWDFKKAGERLASHALQALTQEAVSTRFGQVVPFRLGYPPVPHTLSGCRDTFSPMEAQEYQAYAKKISWCREDAQTSEEQDYLENCYANYRYYPEMLSSELLSPEQEHALAEMRRNLGGEMLGMTRFMDGLDDWPVYHYARYLLRSGQKSRYLLLMFAHLEHHGDRNTGVYYEQRTVDGGGVAPDCVPSALIVPLMLGWMFVYENIEGSALELMRGVPDEWLKKGFRVRGLNSRWGEVELSLCWKENKAELTLNLPQGIAADTEVRLYAGMLCPHRPMIELEPRPGKIVLNFKPYEEENS